MTRAADWTDSDHPSVMLKEGRCSRCQTLMGWNLLEPFILSNQHLQLLCPSCRMARQPIQCEED